MNIAILIFPGTTGDVDCHHALQDTLQASVEYVRHTDTNLSKFDCIVIPGGASYGDYLRPGAIASKTPVMESVVAAVKAGKYVLGIGNGFQILLEAGLLPGAMLFNHTLKFNAQSVTLHVENNRNPFTIDYSEKQSIELPIAHGAGNYYGCDQTIAQLQANDQIIFRYASENPNGSKDNIAGICNEQGNVLGMMPHPERAITSLLGSADGRQLFTSILKTWREKHDAAIS